MPEIPVLEPAPEQVASPSGRRRLLPTLFALVLLAGGAAGGWYWFTLKHAAEAEGAAAPLGRPVFIKLDPPFVVNFEARQLVRFLQVTVEVMSRDPATVAVIEANEPVVRNDLLFLFGNQKYADIATREGKERLREQALETVRQVVAAAGGRPERVEAVYFTSFVMQ